MIGQQLESLEEEKKMEEDEMSDYEDENFELDETDEHWGTEPLPCHELNAHLNDIKKKNQDNLHLRNRPDLKIFYKYKDAPPVGNQILPNGFNAGLMPNHFQNNLMNHQNNYMNHQQNFLQMNVPSQQQIA